MKLNTPQPEAVVSFYNLKPNKEYQFRVIAINDVGISPPSADSEFLTTLGRCIILLGHSVGHKASCVENTDLLRLIQCEMILENKPQ